MDTDAVASAVRHRPSRHRDGGPTHVRASLSELVDQLSEQELSELIYRRTTSQQLEDILSLKRAQERDDGPHYADELERLRRQSDPETAQAWAALQQAPRKVANIAALWRAMGVDDGIIGAVLVRRLTENGVEPDQAERMVIRAGVDWTPRSDSDCWRKVAEEMIRDGFTPDQVRDAITAVRARQAVAA